MSTSLDLSSNRDLAPIAAVIAPVCTVVSALNMPIFLMGATARDIWLTHLHGRPIIRATADVDFGVMVADWSAFETVRGHLIASGYFQPRSEYARHKLEHSSGLPLDIVPFGGIERPDRKIAWPPEQSTIYNCFGMKEAYATCSTIRLPGSVETQIPSIPALALLKIQAWQDRKHSHPGKDAPDLLSYARHYLDCGNFPYATRSHPDLFEADDLDAEEVSAQLLGRDIAALLDDDACVRIGRLLADEANENGALLLAYQSKLEINRARRLIAALAAQFK